jgi:exopolysaccharide biosynthesis polyprenyl glycosylphosphotransferase
MLSEGRRQQLRVLLAIVLDACTIASAFSLAYLLRFYWELIPASDSPPAQPYFAILPVLVPVWIAIFAAYGLYRERVQGFFDEALRVTSAVSVGLMTLLAGSFFYRQFSYSRLWILFAWGLSIVLVLVSRGVVRAAHRALRARGVDVRRVLIVGTGMDARDLARVLRDHPESGQLPVAFVDGASAGQIDGLPVVGRPEDVLGAVRKTGAHRVIIALPAEARETILQVAAACQEAGVPFGIVPDLYTLIASGAQIELVDRLPLLTLHGSPLTGWGRRLKDTLDVVGALLGLILTLPLWAVIAVLIVTGTPGPVFYRQKRIGKAGVPFSAWKFRTMVAGADKHLVGDAQLRERFAAAFKLADDPRVTRIGRWLRRTSLDELPQLLNVLKGEMSLVGPRPIVEEELQKYGPWERRLLCVKPGLTGLWQILRHHRPDYAQRVSLDMYYIEHWSVGLDLKILLRTFPSVIAGRGAY